MAKVLPDGHSLIILLVMSSLREVGIFSDEETEQALKMVDDRNLTAHTYDEDMAKELVEHIYVYESLLQSWYRKMVNG